MLRGLAPTCACNLGPTFALRRAPPRFVGCPLDLQKSSSTEADSCRCRSKRLVTAAADRNRGDARDGDSSRRDARDGDPARRDFIARSRKGKAYEKKTRRRGRPAHTRSPDDTPLRDGNRDRLMGLLTERAVKTLLFYLMETNLNLHYWLSAFLAAHPIPRDGAWDDVSGESFLRTLLGMPVQEAKYSVGRSQMYDHVKGMGVDPRSLAQRIMDIRRQMATEFIIDLQDVPEENLLLLRESLSSSLEKLLSLPLHEEDADP